MHPPDTSMEQLFLDAYDQYAQAIFRHCALRLRDRERGKELMQDTFVRVWESIQKGTEIENFRAFLYKVANNLIIDAVRRGKLRSEDSLEEMEEEKGFELPDKEAGPARKTEWALAMDAVGKLAEPYKTAVMLRYIDGLPPSEIAELLGESPNVVSVHIHRGLKELESFLSTPNE